MITSKPRSTSSFVLVTAALGVVVGLIWGMEPIQLSRWKLYQAISLGSPRDKAVLLVDSSDNSLSGCGAFRSESKDSVCRFEDAWRGYVINFDSNTGLVNRKSYYFKRLPGIPHPKP